MATYITQSNIERGLRGSPEKRLEYAPDGTLWLLLVEGRNAKFFKSRNGGATWAYVPNSDVFLHNTQYLPSFFIDAQGYAHMSWVRYKNDPQIVMYARGRPTSGGGWTWTKKTISPASARLRVDSDVVAHRLGTGWNVWVLYSTFPSDVRVARLDVSANGTITVAATSHGPPAAAVNRDFGSLEFHHNGYGKVPGANPHLYLVTANQWITNSPVLFHRALRSGSTWTWEEPVTADSAVDVAKTVMVSTFDGERLCAIWVANSTNQLRFGEWVPGETTVTRRDPTALPTGTGQIGGVSIAHDPVTDNLYVAAYDIVDGDIFTNVMTRSTAAWSGWTRAIARPADASEGKVQMVRHAPRDAVDLVYGHPLGNRSYKIYYYRVTNLDRTPDAPKLRKPAAGSRLDLAAGATFTWNHTEVSLGDTQQAWAFRRTLGTTTEYWNDSSKAWSTTEVWNTGSTEQASFDPGKWTNGNTYTWSVRTRASSGSNSPYAADRTVVATAAPDVAVTAPYGIHYGDTTPLVEWTYTSAEAQRDYEIRVVEATGTIDPNNPGPAVWTSGTVTSSVVRAHRVEIALNIGTGYRAYVRAANVSGVYSPWVYSDFTISAEPPSGPLVEVYDEIYYSTNVPRVRMRLVARSNFLAADQAEGQAGWENYANATVEAQAEDLANTLSKSLRLTSIAAGDVVARTVTGTPPTAPPNEPQPLGPLDFPAMEGQAYTALAAFRHAGATARAARVSIQWFSNDDDTVPEANSLISTSISEQVVTSPTAYVAASVSAVAPIGARRGRVLLTVLGATAAGEIFYARNLSFHPGYSTTPQPGGYADIQTMLVERSIDSGLTWEVFSTREKPNIYQVAVIYDRTMPFNTDVMYRAYSEVDLGNDIRLTSASSPVSTLSIEANLWAIRDPEDDDGEKLAFVIQHDRNDAEAAVVHRVAGREMPIVDSDGAQAAEGEFDIYVPAVDRDSMIELIRRTTPLIIQSPIGELMKVRILKRDYDVRAAGARRIACDYVQVG